MNNAVRNMCVVLSIISAAGFAADRERFAIGYDGGVSLRFSLLKNATLSIIGRPSNGTSSNYYYNSVNNLYINDKNETIQNSGDNYIYHNTHETKSKGVGVFAKLAYKIDSKMGFSASPYLEIGGEYGTFTQTNSSWTEYTGSYSYYQSTPTVSTRTNSYSYTKGIAEIGIMPGYTYKWLTIQFKVGIGAEMSMSDPETGSVGNDGKSTRVYLSYPQYDIVNSFSIHLGVF